MNCTILPQKKYQHKITINRFDDPEEIAYYFKARTDWMPWANDTKCWFSNWAEDLNNDSCKFDSNYHGERYIVPDNISFLKDCLTLRTVPIEQVEMGGRIFTHKSVCLAGKQVMNRFRINIDAKFSCDFKAVDAIWTLTPDTVLPEWDLFETNTPGCSGQLSQSLLTGTTYPAKVKWSKKYHIDKCRGIKSYKAIKTNRLHITTSPVFSLHFAPSTPEYLIIWNAVQRHQNLVDTAEMKIYNIEIEYE